MKLTLHLKLESDTTFGRGDGIPNVVDEEVEHDPDTGLPFLRGKTLKGLLLEECANLLYAADQINSNSKTKLETAARYLFGEGGSTLEEQGKLRVGQARLPEALRHAVANEVKHNRLTPPEVLESLTAIRRQTAINETNGAPELGSLRSDRVILRETPFVAELTILDDTPDEEIALLQACVMSLRRVGSSRNRGRGRVSASLKDENGEDLSLEHYENFKKLIEGNS